MIGQCFDIMIVASSDKNLHYAEQLSPAVIYRTIKKTVARSTDVLAKFQSITKFNCVSKPNQTTQVIKISRHRFLEKGVKKTQRC